jgi:hypothetical protein
MESKEPKTIEVTFRIDPEGYREMERLRELLGTKNLATALYSAVSMLEKLYDYQKDGYQVALVKNGTTLKMDLPKTQNLTKENEDDRRTEQI